jgi:hypothetical protein
MTDHKFQLVVQFAGNDIADFDEMIELEDRLTYGLADRHLVDGHDVRSGEVNIFVHTNDPILACDEVMGLLEDGQRRRAKIAYRSFRSDEYAVLWPLDVEQFSIA